MEEKKIEKIFIDMDGVIAHFDHPSNFHPEDQKIRKPPRAYEKGFFEKLPVLEGALWGVRNLIRMYGIQNVYILTAPLTYNLECYTEKARWIAKYFPELLPNIIINGNKEICAKKGYVLIDDHVEWEDKWTQNEGIFYHFNGSSLNTWKHINEVFKKEYL